MNVKQLIKELMKVKNKNSQVNIWNNDEIYKIDLVDISIDNRVDLNMGERR